MEELIGNHGGVGGPQTDAFIFHPPDLDVPETHSSMDVFHILNNHRGTPVPEKPIPTIEVVADWAPATMTTGIGRIKTWLGYAVRCLFLDRSAYKEVAADPYMTGPALLIALLAAFLGSLVRAGGLDLTQFIATVAVWLLAIYILFLAGYSLTKKGTFTKTFRVRRIA